ncbi:hypothetical protein [Streptomyces sp. NBC_00212]
MKDDGNVLAPVRGELQGRQHIEDLPSAAEELGPLASGPTTAARTPT